MGWLARKYGLQANSVTAIELVTADGRAARVDAEHEPDLFWALRGGNGNFGVVTAIEFAVYPVEELYAGVMFFPFERAGRGPARLDRARPDAAGRDDDLGVAAAVPGRPVRAGARPRRLVRRRLRRLPRQRGRGPRTAAPRARPRARRWTRSRWSPPAVLGDMAMDPPDPLPFLSTTALLSDLPSAGVDDLVAAAGPGSGSPLAMVELRLMGGALGAPLTGRRGAGDPAGQVQHVRARGARGRARRRRPRGRTSSPSSAPSLPYRAGDYPNFVEDAGRRERRSSTRTPGRACAGEGALRPERPVQGQPPHPARRGELKGARDEERGQAHRHIRTQIRCDGHPRRARRRFPRGGIRRGERLELARTAGRAIEALGVTDRLVLAPTRLESRNGEENRSTAWRRGWTAHPNIPDT